MQLLETDQCEVLMQTDDALCNIPAAAQQVQITKHSQEGCVDMAHNTVQ
jgi:hypothetical protein